MLSRGMRALAPLSVLALVAGCTSAAESEPAPTETVTATATETVTASPEPAPTVTETVTADPELEETEESAAGEADLTEEIRKAAGDMVREVTQVGQGQYEISTLIIDPREDDGSPEAQEAIEICETVQQELGAATSIHVLESDDTIFAWIDPDTGECVEV